MSKENRKSAGYDLMTRFQGDACQCTGHGSNSRDQHYKSDLETRMSKVATAQGNCDIHCERARKKMCESNNVWKKGEERREKANKMQKRGEERCLIERELGGGKDEESLREVDFEKRKRGKEKRGKQEDGGGEEEESPREVDDEEKRKRRTCDATGRICNHKESCQKNILKTSPTRGGGGSQFLVSVKEKNQISQKRDYSLSFTGFLLTAMVSRV